jgi:hypothetical protein
MERRAFLSALAGLATAAIAVPAAEAGAWAYLGRKKVSAHLDHDVLYVGGHRGLFTKLRFKVTGNHLELYRMRVVYANGQWDELPAGWFVPQGSITRMIDLAGNRRRIDEIHFLYSHPVNFKGKAHVTVWGRR